MNQQLSVHVFPKGKILSLPGDNLQHLYLLEKGEVKVSKYSADGREVILEFIKPGEVFGEMALLEGMPWEVVLEVTKESRIGLLPVQPLQQILFRNVTFSRMITQLMGRRLSALQSRYEAVCFEGAPGRIKKFIREQADKYGRKVGYEIDLLMTLTHQDIAKLTITSRQTVTGVLSELERKNIISYNRKRILIRDYRSLLQ